MCSARVTLLNLLTEPCNQVGKDLCMVILQKLLKLSLTSLKHVKTAKAVPGILLKLVYQNHSWYLFKPARDFVNRARPTSKQRQFCGSSIAAVCACAPVFGLYDGTCTMNSYLATRRMDEKGWTLYTGSTPLLPPGVMSLGGCKFVSTTLLHVLPSGAAGKWASMAKV